MLLIAPILGVVLFGAGCSEPKSEPPSLLVIVIDTCRADYVGWNGKRLPDGRSPTPAMDQLAQSAVGPRAAFTPVPLTLPAHTTLFSGLSPRRHGVRENDSFAVTRDPLRRGYSLLAEDLKAAGYETAAFVSADPLGRRFGLDAGFDVYDDVPQSARGESEFLFAERNAEATTSAALNWLERRRSRQRDSKPFLLFVHYFDPHAPYVPARAGEAPFGADTKAWLGAQQGAYLAEISRVDHSVGRLLQAAQASAKALGVVITADHGEALGEGGETTHGYRVQDVTLKVPLLLVPPLGKVLSEALPPVARLEDLYPTLLGWAGVQATVPVDRDGKDLAEPARTPWRHYAETTYPWYQFGYAQVMVWRDLDRKLVEGGGRAELFAWPTEVDREERSATESQRRDQLLQELQAFTREPALSSAEEVRLTTVEPRPYMGVRAASKGVEPDPGRNRELPRVEDRWPVIHALEQALALLGEDKALASKAVLLLEEHADERDSNPALLFWTARSRHWAGRQENLSAASRLAYFAEAERLYEQHAARYRDARSVDAQLRLMLDRWFVTKDPREAQRVVQQATGEIGAGADRPLPFIFRAQAREILGEVPLALEDLLKARTYDREDPRLASEVERVSKLISR